MLRLPLATERLARSWQLAWVGALADYGAMRQPGLASFVISELRHRRGRAAGLGVGVLVAAVSFSLLTASASTSTAEVRSTVGVHARAAYDILVRPPGSDTQLENSAGLVQANYLSGIFGGITLAQWHQVQKVDGVAVAAPVAMVGYVLPLVSVPVDVTKDLTAASRQVFRVQQTWTGDNGLSTIKEPADYLYVTRNRVSPSSGAEIAPDVANGAAPVCDGAGFYAAQHAPSGPFTNPVGLFCWSIPSNGPDDVNGGVTYIPGHVQTAVSTSFPFLLAAIDPVQEAMLDGVNAAVTAGRYLSDTDTDTVQTIQGYGHHTIPVLAASTPFVSDTLHVTVQRLDLPSSGIVSALTGPQAPAQLAASRSATVLRDVVTPAEAYQQLLARPLQIDNYWSSSPASYQVTGAKRVGPIPVTNPPTVWRDKGYGSGYAFVPQINNDVGFRLLDEHQGSSTLRNGILDSAELSVVGHLDPSKLASFDPLTSVPLSTFVPPDELPADARSSAILHGKSLPPDANIAGYLQPPPLLLTTVNALADLTNPTYYAGADSAAPISVIRIRVGQLHGSTREQLTRIGQIAAQIKQRTGLQVDVTAGASPTPVTVDLPAGHYGRPALALGEPWVAKGTAVAVLTAVDRKSVFLFVLVLLVCVFFLANSAYASVRVRRKEIATLRTMGWSAGEVFAAVLGEVALIGGAAGVLGAGVAAGLAAAFSLHLAMWRVLLVIPAAFSLALGAGFGPAWRASRAQPLDGLRPRVRRRRRPRRVHSVTGLALSNLASMPGRALLGAAGLTLGITALTVLLAISFAFRGAVTGDLLGNVVAVQVRNVDYVSAALAVVLGACGVADVLLLNQRERAAELATLRACGWSENDLVRLTLVEGFTMAAVGSVTGAVIGLGVAASISTDGLPSVALGALVACCGGTIIVGLTLLAPTWTARRIAPARALAEET